LEKPPAIARIAGGFFVTGTVDWPRFFGAQPLDVRWGLPHRVVFPLSSRLRRRTAFQPFWGSAKIIEPISQNGGAAARRWGALRWGKPHRTSGGI